MKTGNSLEIIYQESLSHFTGDEEIKTELRYDLEKRYTNSSRCYHNLAHLTHLTNTLWQVKNEIFDWDIMVLAIAYHDIIYNIHKSDNEERSADYADKILSGILPAEKRELLSQFIIATKAHGKNENVDINYFTDADLSILGADPDEYVLYTKQIRNEYKFYPFFIYKPGRVKVARQFLQMDAIFKTDFFYNKLENKARENLQRELKELNR